jgi:hypothetical protein
VLNIRRKKKEYGREAIAATRQPTKELIEARHTQENGGLRRRIKDTRHKGARFDELCALVFSDGHRTL